MNGQMAKLGRAVLGPFLRNRYTRPLFTAHLYRRWIAHSEAAIALRSREEDLDESYWMGKLRQYAHILDKGLHRCDFSKGHGNQVHALAKRALAHVTSPEGQQDPSVAWAARRIELYEDLQSGRLPGLTSEYTASTCTYEELLNVMKTRRSIRRYRDEPVEDGVIDKITDVLDWCPTSCNRQPTRVYATSNPDIVRQCVRLHGGASCFTEIHAPLFLTFCADVRVYEMPVEVAMPHIDVALGVENCVLAAHALGLSLTLLTWALHTDYQDRELRKVLGIPRHFQIVVSAVGGYPDGGVQVPARKNKELFIVR